MNIFNSLGSNYDDAFVKKALFTKNDPGYIHSLISFLEKKYGGEVHVTYKGRDALALGLASAHLPPQAKVVITGFTCVAVFKAVQQAGFTPILLDIEGTSLNFTPKILEETLKKDLGIKAVIIQNTLSYPIAIEQIQKLCKEYNCILIEDGAHCIGTIYDTGKEVGTIGDLVALSFSQDKIVDGISGGALIIRKKSLQRLPVQTLPPRTSLQELKDRLYPLLTTLIRHTYPYLVGKILHFVLRLFKLLSQPLESTNTSYALSPFHAKLILDSFERLSDDITHRQQIAQMYHQYLDKSIQSAWIGSHILTSANMRFPIFVKNRKELISFLKGKGVYVNDIWYDAPIAPRSQIDAPMEDESLIHAQLVCREILNLPTHKNVTSSQAIAIASLINQWLKQNK